MNRKEHLLTILIEECAEVIKEATKSLRFGLDDYYQEPPINKEKISLEMADLNSIYLMLVKENVINPYDGSLIIQKQEKIEKFLGYSKMKGTLNA